VSSVYGGVLLPYSEEDGVPVNRTVSEDANLAEIEEGLSTDTGEFSSNVNRVIFHPKVLGLLFVLMIGAIAIKMLTGAAKPK
jgi:hypothetical protein